MRFILCDDHPFFSDALAELLAARRHEVLAITVDPREAWRLSEQEKPDVVTMDLGYDAGPDETEVLALIQSISAFSEVLVVSGMDTKEMRGKALSSGASAFASKGLPADDLVQLAEGHIDLVAPDPDAHCSAQDRYFLTDRECEVLACLAEGDSTTRIAERLHVRASTARSHVQNVLMKLGVHNRVAAVSLCVTERLIEPRSFEYNAPVSV